MHEKVAHRAQCIGRILAAAAGLFVLSSAVPLGTGERYILGEYKEASTAFEAHFIWTLGQPMNHLRVLGAAPDANLQSTAPESPRVHLYADAEGKQLIAEFEYSHKPLQSAKLSAYGSESLLANRQGEKPSYRAELLGSVERRQPNGKRHIIRHILLSCTQTDANGKVVIYLQQLELDATLGSIDTIPCQHIPPRYAALLLPAQDYRSAAPTGLPEKYNGAPLRRDILRLLYAIAAIDSPRMASTATPEIAAFAWQLAARAPFPKSPWPHCWGETAEDAREAARQLTASLIYLQDNDCFGSQQLADFINSPLFARIFGESFTEPPAAPVQEEPILYETTANTSTESEQH